METGAALKEKGISLFGKGKFADALESFTKAYYLFEAEGMRTEAGEMLNNIGMVHRELEEDDQALEMMKRAREVFSEIGDASREGQTLANMAPLHIRKKQHADASKLYTEAEALLEEAGEPDMLGEVLMSHGLHEFEHGDRKIAPILYERGLMKIKKPTAKQKRLKALLKLKTSL